jgi:hypothetical protein
MQTDHALYSYNYLYKISTNPAFIEKMIALFVNSVVEYSQDLQQLQSTRVLHDLKRTVHKLKPSVLSMEVAGAKDAIAKLEGSEVWNAEVEVIVEQLVVIFQKIKPMMEEDLKNLPL